MKYHTEIYNHSYYMKNAIKASHANRTLKYQDSWPALCFALGAAETYEQALKLIGLSKNDSLNFEGNLINNPYENDNVYSLWDSVAINGIHIEEQIDILKKNMKRKPKGVLDIGIGRGETSLVLSELGIPVIGFEPSPICKTLVAETSKLWKLDPQNLTVISDFESLPFIDFDTLLFCCCIEHIYEDFCDKLINHTKPAINNNNGLLITSNTINQYPLPVDGKDHVVCVDDFYYQRLAHKHKLSVLYHETNMFIGQFAKEQS